MTIKQMVLENWGEETIWFICLLNKVKILNTFGAQSTFQSHDVDNLRGSLHARQARRLIEQLTGELRELQDVAARN